MNTMAADNIKLTYLVREPKIKTEKPPVIILLHGVGSNERDLFSLADDLPPDFLVVSARGPITLGPSRYAWYEVDFSTGRPSINAAQEATSRQMILNFIDELQQRYSFDRSRVYLGGFSQGAIMSYSIGLTHPEKVKGLVIMSGRMLDEIKPLVAPREQLQKLYVFISHGTKDGVLKVEYARDARDYLKQAGIKPFYKEYAIAHTINGDVLKDLISWLLDTR